MPRTSKKAPQGTKSPTPDQIADMATRGQDVSAFFTNKFTVVRPIQRVNVDLTHGMLRELDSHAPEAALPDGSSSASPRLRVKS